MRQLSVGSRCGVASALVCAVVGGAALTGAGPAAGAGGQASVEVLDTRDAELLEQAQSAGKQAVTVIMATDRGGAGKVATAVERLGGSVAQRFDETGYVLAAVPTGEVVKAAKLPGVAAVDLDDVLKVPEPRPDAKAGERALQAVPVGPGAGTPAENAFLPTNEIGAVAFKEQNPGYDGRGVTIGIMDSGVDVDHPALQTTTTGERKITNWVTATDPVLDGDGTWRVMVSQVNGPSFSYASTSWTAPAGTYRISQFAERTTAGSAYNGDVNRDGDNADSFGVLYDPVSRDIRVDSDQDRNFTNNPVMRPYRERYDIGHFGVDKPDTAIREEVPFVVQFRADVDMSPLGGAYVGKKYDFVNIGITSSDHGTHVAGIAAGNDMFGNANFDGAAPGAKIVSMRACLWGSGCSSSALTTGMIDLVENHHVDVINMSIGGVLAVNDGNSARGLLYNRLIAERGVQIFLSAGNSGPGLNTVGDPSVASESVSVGSTVSKATALANYGSPVRADQALQTFSSRGPREDGGFKPNIVAPGSAISTVPTWTAGAPTPGVAYPLPPGYAMLQGTSMAAPQATGGAALLLSAAKARKLTVTPPALRRAISSSAQWIDGVPAHGQGNGLLNIPGAWKLLEKSPETRTYTIDAPVCTVLSKQLPTPNRGAGIYNRCPAMGGGHKPARSKSYKVTITRTGGPDRAITHNLKWIGNDGTYQAPAKVVLPLRTAVTISVTATPLDGAHSAILRIDDPATATVDAEMLSTVIAASEINEPPSYGRTLDGSVDRNEATSVFVNVPAGVEALKLALGGIEEGSQTRFLAADPQGLPVDNNSGLACYTNYSDATACDPQHRNYPEPQAGVWEFHVESRRTSPAVDNTFALTTEATGLELLHRWQCNGYWLLDEHTHDVVGAGSYADLLGGTLGAPGRNYDGRSAAQFDGTPDQGAVVWRPMWGYSRSLTVSAWVRLTDMQGWHTAVSQHGPKEMGFRLAYNNAARSWEFALGRRGGGETVVRSTAVTPNKWTHLAGVYNKERSGIALYVDGHPVGSVPVTDVAEEGSDLFSIGRDHRRDDNYVVIPGPGTWAGEISDVGLWLDVLDYSAIMSLADPLNDIVRPRYRPPARPEPDPNMRRSK